MTTNSSTSNITAQPSAFFNSDSRRIGLQLYTLGELPKEDLDAIFAQIAEIGYLDIEMHELYGREPAEVKAAADRAGVTISSLHIVAIDGLGDEALTLYSDARKIADSLGALDVTQAVVPIAPFPPGFKFGEANGDPMHNLAQAYVDAGENHWKQAAELLNEKASVLKPLGISLGYHNHNMEFAPMGNTSGWEILVKGTDPDLIDFEIDTGWLAAAGIDPVAFLQQHSGRIRWLHIKDIKPSTSVNCALAMDPVEVGAGKLDWPRIFPAAVAAGVAHFYVEQEPPFEIPRLEAITRSYQYLSELSAR